MSRSSVTRLFVGSLIAIVGGVVLLAGCARLPSASVDKPTPGASASGSVAPAPTLTLAPTSPGLLPTPRSWPSTALIAYVSSDPDGDHVHLLDLRSGEDEIVAAGGHPSWNSLGNRLAFDTPGPEIPGNIALVDIPGGSPHVLVSAGYRPVWSDTARWIAFERSVIDLGDTWVVDLTNPGQPRSVCPGGSSAWLWVDESSVAQWLACLVGSGVPTVAVVRSDGVGYSELVPGADPVWDPLTQRIVFEAWTQVSHDLRAIDPKDGRVVTLVNRTNEPDLEIQGIAMGSAGQVVYAAGGDAYALDAGSAAPRRLTIGLGITTRASVAPDGEWAVVAGSGTAGGDLYAIRTDGGGWVRLTQGIRAGDPVWQPSQ